MQKPPCSLYGKLMSVAIIFILAIMISLLYGLKNTAESFEEQENVLIQGLLLPVVTEIRGKLDIARQYIGGSSLDLLPLSSGTELDRLKATETLGERFAQDLAMMPDVDAIFVYDGKMRFVQNYDSSYSRNIEASAAMEEWISSYDGKTNPFSYGFILLERNNEKFISIATDTNGGICGVWFVFSHLIEKSSIWELAGFIVADIAPENRSQNYYSEDCVVIENPISNTGLSLYTIWNEQILYGHFSALNNIIITSVVISVIILVIYVVSLHTTISHPLKRLRKAISDINSLNTEPIAIDRNESKEIADVYKALNKMLLKQENLRKEKYEEQLLREKTEMKLFQLQIRPHFFLNALNTILSFSEIGDKDKERKMIMCVSTYCKYVLYNHIFVSLDEEIQHTKNYVEMYNLRHEQECIISMDITEELLEEAVPILSVETFVENSLKHGRKENMHLTIRGWKAFDVLYIKIDDDGCGFRPNVNNETEGLGINNMRERLRLLYGGNAEIKLTNNNQGGASVTLALPL